jgi:hypothetical protein
VIDNLDVSLQDDELLAEIGLATALMIAASSAGHRLSAAEVDRVLGVPTAPTVPAQRRFASTSGRGRA